MSTTPIAERSGLAHAHRVVVKVGSSSLTTPEGILDPERLTRLADVLGRRVRAGSQIVLVSSGAQAAGLEPLGLKRRPKTLAQAQAAASVGQGLLMARYTAAFAAHDLTVGQVLLTAQDVIRRAHYRNALRVLTTLLNGSIVPIVNENDAVATNEIRFGDNDHLAALVAHLVRADALVLLTDVDGLYTAPPGRPGSQRIAEVRAFDELAGIDITGRGSGVGTGGMTTKVQAAAMATSSGIPVLLTRADLVEQALDGAPGIGTFFCATGQRIPARAMWLGYAARMKGRLVVDAGAARAITLGKKSLLPVGVVAVSGEFNAGEPVEILDQASRVLARGIAGYSAKDLAQVQGLTTTQIAEMLGEDRVREAVHRDDLVLQARSRRP
jgi:glutamate 5-kinase